METISKINMLISTSRHYGLKVCFEDDKLSEIEKNQFIDKLFEDFQLDLKSKETFISAIDAMTAMTAIDQPNKKFKKFNFTEKMTLTLAPFFIIPTSIIYTSQSTMILAIIMSLFGWGLLIYSLKLNKNV